MTLLLLFVSYAIVFSAALVRAGHPPQAAPSRGAPVRPPARVLIVGATGGTGRQLVAQALERGYAVTARVRAPSRLQVDHPRLTNVQGDVLDERRVDSAIRDHGAVVCALGHNRYFHPTRILSRGIRNILHAMEAHGVPRLVCETSIGIGDSAGRMGLYYTLFVIPLILPFYFWDKTRQERMIAGSTVEWVIVRPGVLTQGGGFLWTVRISRADVAEFMLNQLESDTYVRSATGVCW